MSEVEALNQPVSVQKVTTNLAARKRANSIFAGLTFAPVVISLLVLVVLLLKILTDTMSWQVVGSANSGKSFPITASFQARDIYRLDLEAQGLSKDEIKAVLDDPEEYRKHSARNRVQLMWQTNEGPMRWTVVSIRDDLKENFGVFEGFGKIEEMRSSLGKGDQYYLNPWLDLSYFQGNASRSPATAGLRGAILGSLWVIMLVTLFILPVGLGAAIYLEEYAPKNGFSRFLEINIRNLAGVPSIVYGVLGLTLFVRLMQIGPTILAAALTLGLLVLPIVVIAAREAIRAVPDSLRQAAYGLGSTKWQAVSKVVVPYAAPGIATGVLLAIARAIGETAPLLLVGAAAFVPSDPTGPFSDYTVVPVQIYSWISDSKPEFKNVAASAIMILLVFLVLFNYLVSLVRRRFSR